ncbi:MAG: hypothetical protein H7Z13_19070 [Ferruginibacter sp.]|nr:hypothetical protein [Ferruginibacter sp.]
MFPPPLKINYITGIVLVLLHLGCNQTNETANYTPENNAIQAIDTIYASDRDTVILLNDGEAFIKGHINTNKKQPKYTLPVWKGQAVTAYVKPLTKNGNIRINQVQKPGGVFTSPFDDSLSYTIETNGNILFVIGENLMAGDPYTGEFILHITVK